MRTGNSRAALLLTEESSVLDLVAELDFQPIP